MPRPPPTRIGPYPVVRLLGEGGMGSVYEVQDPQLPRRLALKLIRPGAGLTQAALERFWREANALAKIQHPNVVRIHRLGRAQEGPFILQELVAGKPLDRVMTEDPLEPRQSARVLRELADGLAAVHAQGILHRDLKPQNVILRENGMPLLLDFGLARDVDAETLTKTGQLLGTPAYMAPEQARGWRSSELTAAVDVYGLGAILYALLTGEQPFSGGSTVNVLRQVLKEEPTWPRDRVPETPLELDRICRMAMAKDPAQRYADAIALREDLDRYLEGLETEARAVLRAARRRRVLRRGAQALGGLLLLAWVVGAGVQLLPSEDPPAPSPTPAAAAPSATPRPVARWELTPREEFLLRLEFERGARGLQFRFLWDLSTRVLGQDDGLIRLRGTVVRGRCQLRSIALGSPLGDYDTERPDPNSPLCGLDETLAARVYLSFLGESGAVREVRGMEGIAQALCGRVPQGGSFAGLSPKHLHAFYRETFRDAFFARACSTLLQVTGERPVPWLRDEGAPAERYRLAPGAPPSAPVLWPEGQGERSPDAFRCRLEGSASYAAGRLGRAELSQTLLGRAGPGQALLPLTPADGARRMAWALEIVADAPGGD